MKSFASLARRSLLQLLVFNGIITCIVSALLWIMGRISFALLASRNMAFTSSNAAEVLLSWQGAVLICIGIVVIALYVAFDLFAHVYFCASLLAETEISFLTRTGQAMQSALRAIPRFLSPAGLPTLLYILLLSPLIGFGFSVGLTRGFYIPSFIMDFVNAQPVLTAVYAAIIILLVVIGFLHFFVIHGVLIDNLPAQEARRQSRRIVRSNLRNICKSIVKAVLATACAYLVATAIVIVAYLLVGAVEPLMQSTPGHDEAGALALYRSVCFFVTFLAYALESITVLLVGSVVMLYVTHLFKWFSSGKQEEPAYAARTSRKHTVAICTVSLLAVAALGVASLAAGALYEAIFPASTPAAVVAHRMGGRLAPENSLQGLRRAIELGCYGAETDIQRTKDGHYIINHDDTFKRLTGKKAKPQDMTLAEVKKLRIRDPLFPKKEAAVPTLEEALDVSQGRIVLFIELKGATADRQMVDDVVRILRERKATEDAVLISLNYDCISYAETHYPDIKTGLLFFAQYGDPLLLDCDLLLAEEEATTSPFIHAVHRAKKEVGAWTPNTEEEMYSLLNSSLDYCITDELALAQKVQDELDARSELDVITDIVWSDR